MTSTVVCGVDRSTHAREATRFAAALAGRLGHRLILVHAVPATVPAVVPTWPTRAPHDRADLVAAARAAAEELVGELVEHAGGADVSGRVEHGLAPECLCRVALEQSAGYVVVGAHGESATHTMLLGSTSLATARMAPCPVVVVPPARDDAVASPDGRCIVCGIGHVDDLAPVTVAADLARELELALVPAHVVPRDDEPSSGRTVAGIRERLMDRFAGLAPADAQHAMVAGSHVPEVLVGDPAQQLTRFADEAGAAMVVVGTRGRGAIRSALFGSVSRDLARQGTKPVVVCPRDLAAA
jgi:nucleotide-binding universal stress UspA family protein